MIQTDISALFIIVPSPVRCYLNFTSRREIPPRLSIQAFIPHNYKTLYSPTQCNINICRKIDAAFVLRV